VSRRVGINGVKRCLNHLQGLIPLYTANWFLMPSNWGSAEGRVNPNPYLSKLLHFRYTAPCVIKYATDKSQLFWSTLQLGGNKFLLWWNCETQLFNWWYGVVQGSGADEKKEGRKWKKGKWEKMGRQSGRKVDSERGKLNRRRGKKERRGEREALKEGTKKAGWRMTGMGRRISKERKMKGMRNKGRKLQPLNSCYIYPIWHRHLV